ncbi:MAG TPA: amino acid permease, partial [Gemmataceae bacterium]|nr:amino acid permease [Gemmataceae bacterium]
LGGSIGKVFLCDVIFAVFVCTLAVQTNTVRLIFAMARDSNLPMSSLFARVSATSRTPIVPAILAGVLAAAILVVNVNIPHFIDLIAPAAILWANLAYLLVTAPMLWRRLKGWPGSGGTGLFSLGRWGVVVNVLAVCWGVLMIVNIGWPRAGEPDMVWYARYGAILLTGALTAVGGLYYFFFQRHKTGVLPEHQS